MCVAYRQSAPRLHLAFGQLSSPGSQPPPTAMFAMPGIDTPTRGRAAIPKQRAAAAGML